MEADPAVVNLSAFEVFFQERRPFFLENADAFAFGEAQQHVFFVSGGDDRVRTAASGAFRGENLGQHAAAGNRTAG